MKIILRLAIARAFIKKPKFLILYEATNNLDFISEAKIYNTLFVKGKDITMLIIAHRLSTIRNCDIIYVLDKGKVVEEGNHETLLRKKGYYYRLYVSQVGEMDNSKNEDNSKEIIVTKNIEESEVVLVEGEEYEYN